MSASSNLLHSLTTTISPSLIVYGTGRYLTYPEKPGGAIAAPDDFAEMALNKSFRGGSVVWLSFPSSHPMRAAPYPPALPPTPTPLHTRVVRPVSGPRRDVVAGVLHSRGHRASSWHESHSETVGPNRRRQSRLISLAVIRRVNQPATHILSVSPPIFKPMESGNGGTEEEMGHQQRNGGLYDAECMDW